LCEEVWEGTIALLSLKSEVCICRIEGLDNGEVNEVFDVFREFWDLVAFGGMWLYT
jgi:hypothetical protein